MKKVPPLKLSQEKLVERGGKAWKSSPKICNKYNSENLWKSANIFVGTIQRRFGKTTCRWRAGSMSPRLSVKLINVQLDKYLSRISISVHCCVLADNFTKKYFVIFLLILPPVYFNSALVISLTSYFPSALEWFFLSIFIQKGIRSNVKHTFYISHLMSIYLSN